VVRVILVFEDLQRRKIQQRAEIFAWISRIPAMDETPEAKRTLLARDLL